MHVKTISVLASYITFSLVSVYNSNNIELKITSHYVYDVEGVLILITPTFGLLGPAVKK